MITVSDLTEEVLLELHDQSMDDDDSMTAARCILAMRNLRRGSGWDVDDASHLTRHMNSIGAITRLQLLPYAKANQEGSAMSLAEHLGEKEFTTIREILADVGIPAQVRIVIATDLILGSENGALAKSDELYVRVLGLLAA